MKLIWHIAILTLFVASAASAEVRIFGKLPPEVERLLGCQKALKSRAKHYIEPTTGTSNITYYPAELGDYEFEIESDRQSGVRRVVDGYFESEGHIEMYSFDKLHLEFMRDAKNNQESYFAVSENNPKNDSVRVQFHSLEAEKVINRKIDQQLELTWRIYREQGTVTAAEIREFKRQEALLAPQRKITFATRDNATGDFISIMRLYDGSPFPGGYFVGFGEHFYSPKETDPRLPVERRYADIDFREQSEHIFEAGRLAKDARDASALEKHFQNLANFFKKKYGRNGIVPNEFMQGRVYIEITGRNLAKFLRKRSNDGYGFHRFRNIAATATEGEKYLLYATVKEFISGFGGPVRFEKRGGYSRIVE